MELKTILAVVMLLFIAGGLIFLRIRTKRKNK